MCALGDLANDRIKESRLRAEFREQDSYINSDYDEDTDSDDPSSTAGPSNTSSTSQSPSDVKANGKSAERPLTNSIIDQVIALRRAVKALPRPLDLPVPRIRYVLNRLEEHPEGGHIDPRIPATFAAIRKMGVDLVIGSPAVPPLVPRIHPTLVPTRRIMLDLSVVVALCCDSTHFPLPTCTEDLEARFRPYRIDEQGEKFLVDHTPVTKDLRDQLSWETAHPVIEEIQNHLGQAGHDESEVEFYVTQEVKDRTPGIVDLIGGPREQARVRALYGDSTEDFWLASRYRGREGILRNIKAKVLETDLEAHVMGLSMIHHPSMFDLGVVSVCERMLGVIEGTSTPNEEAAAVPVPLPLTITRQRKRRSRNPRRPHVVFPPPQRLPSVHTLRTMILGIKSGMTVLTNNRGAVGKVIREMGVQEGLPFERDTLRGGNADGKGEKRQNATLWVVNPSSLAEWRRLEVEQVNAALEEGSGASSLTT